ncbi:hypothetical protein Tco_0756705 [Tanacetum coccineum]
MGMCALKISIGFERERRREFSVENDDDLSTSGEIQSRTSTTPIVERIDKLKRQIIEGKLTLVDDDRKPLPKVVSTKSTDSDCEVEDVVDDYAVLWYPQA